MKRLRVQVAALELEQPGEVLEGVCDVRMAGPERPLTNLERPLLERHGLPISTLVLVEHHEVVQRSGDVRVIGA